MVRIVIAFAAALVLPAGPAAADSDSSRDRAELEMAAGRIVFQPTSLYGAIANPGLASPGADEPVPAARPARAASGRRPVRVVYPGLYGR